MIHYLRDGVAFPLTMRIIPGEEKCFAPPLATSALMGYPSRQNKPSGTGKEF